VREHTAEGADFFLQLRNIGMHTCLFGATGSGKSTTVKRIISQLALNRVPVLVIDWHSEYDSLVQNLGGKVLVPPTAKIRPIPPEEPLHWNILDPRFYSEQVTEKVIEDYIGLVVDLLGENSILHFTEPQKYGMSKLLNLAFQDYSQKEFPTVKTLLKYLEEVEIPGSTKNALQRKLDNFSSGSQGSIFCQPTSFQPGQLLDTPACIKMRHLTEDFPSAVALLTYFALRQAISYFKRQGEASNNEPVRHVTIIDEAPRVIAAHKKVETYVEKILEEMRKYGEGLILVARNTGIGKGVLRETNQKIAHRLDEKSDIATVAELMGISETKDLIRRLPRGMGFVRTGTEVAKLVKVSMPE
jgi:DNA helicase HerA-like ATPase